MPSGEVAQVRLDHLRCVFELRFHHGLGAELLDLIYDLPSVAPAVEVAAVECEHLADQAELALPELDGGVSR